MRNLLSWARCLLLYWPAVFLITVILEPLTLLAGACDRSGRAQHAVVRLWSAMVLLLLARVKASGLENVENPNREIPHPSQNRARVGHGTGRLYAANHLSSLDIPLLYRYLPMPFRIMAHRRVFRVPLIGWYLRASGALEIAPESLPLTRRALREAVQTLRGGRSLVIFPEGERSPTGAMLPFRRGAFYVALQAQADIVPIAIRGTYEALPVGSAHLRRGQLQFNVGESIAVAGYTHKDLGALAERAQTAVAELLETAADKHR